MVLRRQLSVLSEERKPAGWAEREEEPILSTPPLDAVGPPSPYVFRNIDSKEGYEDGCR